MEEREQRAHTLVRLERERAPHGFVGGLDVQSEGNLTVEVLDAAELSPLGRCPIAHARDIEKAAEAARQAADRWREGGPAARADALEALAALIDEREDDLALLECLQTGRSFRDVLARDLGRGRHGLRLAAAWARSAASPRYALEGGAVGYVEPAPYAVRGAVLPGAEPLAAALRHLLRAVCSGSGLVLLAPAAAPLTVLRLGVLTREAGWPAGALNVLISDGREAPERLAEAPLVDAIVFAGPRDVARRMLVGAAKSNLKTVQLELDGKVPCVIREDAELGPAVDAIWRSALTSPCQLGRSIERALVHRSLFADVAARVTSLAKATIVGHPLGEHTELGPLADAAHLKRVLKYVELGRREGAKLVAGGERDVEGKRFAGAFVKPTVFLDPPADGRLVREPIEGPVVTIEPFDTEDEAVALAGRGLGRLGACVHGRDLAATEALGRRLGVGQLWINGPPELHPELPHAGAGESSGPLAGREGCLGPAELRSVVVAPRRP